MPSVMQTIAKLEGLTGILTDSNGAPDQGVATWVECCKAVMRQPALREKTDWDIVGSTSDLDETEDTIYAAASTLYGVLGENIGSSLTGAGEDYIISTYNAANPTVASTDLNDGGNLSSSFVIRNAAATTTFYRGVVFPGGLAHDTAITVAATQRDEGTDSTLNAARAWCLIRQV